MKKKINSSARIEKVILSKNLKKNNIINDNGKILVPPRFNKSNNKNKKIHADKKNINLNTQKNQLQQKESKLSASYDKYPKRLCQEKNEQVIKKNKIESDVFSNEYNKNNKKLNVSQSTKKYIKAPNSRSQSKSKSKKKNVSDEFFDLGSIQLKDTSININNIKTNNNKKNGNINDTNDDNKSSKIQVNYNNINNNKNIDTKINDCSFIKKKINIKITKKSNVYSAKKNPINNNKTVLQEPRKSSSFSLIEWKDAFSLPENFEKIISINPIII